MQWLISGIKYNMENQLHIQPTAVYYYPMKQCTMHQKKEADYNSCSLKISLCWKLSYNTLVATVHEHT